MSVSFEQVRGLVEDELSRHDIPNARARLTPFLVTPTPLRLTWQYGDDGEAFDTWLVGRSADGSIRLVYCTEGLGESFPWGGVFLADGDMGTDGQWHSGLADAAIGLGLISAPPGYESPGPRD